MSAPITKAMKFAPGFFAVFIGEKCVGHIIARGRSGVEALDGDDQPLGFFPTVAAAAEALAVQAVRT